MKRGGGRETESTGFREDGQKSEMDCACGIEIKKTGSLKVKKRRHLLCG
jgi:hypothetical protein